MNNPDFHYEYETYIYYSDKPSSMNCFHCHSLTELLLIERGHSEIITEGGKITADGPFIVQYPEGMLHLQRNSADQPYSRYQLTFPTGSMSEFLPPAAPLSEFFLIPIPPELVQYFSSVYRMLLDTAGHESEPGIVGRRRLLTALNNNDLMPLMPKKITLAHPDIVSNEQRVFNICRYIGEHFREKLTLEGLSREFFISRSALVRDFRLLLDTTVVEYITNVRVAKAKTHLKNGMSVSETAESCGFSSDSYFIKVFKSITGSTPAAFRDEFCREKVVVNFGRTTLLQ